MDLEDAFEEFGANISQRSIEKWFSGRVKPSRSNAHRIARIAGCEDDRQKQAWADCFIRCLSEPKAKPVKNESLSFTLPKGELPKFEEPVSTASVIARIDDRSVPSRPAVFKTWWIAILLCLIAGLTIFVTQWKGTEYSQNPVRIGINPFANDTSDHAGDFILSGLRSDLGYSLAQLDDIKLITPRELKSIDPKLNPDFLINASMETEEGRDSIRLWLEDSNSGKQLWARSFDPDFFSISEINSVTIKDIGSTIGLAIPESRLAEIVQFGTADPAAHTAYLKGRHLLKNWHETRRGDDIWLANEYFDEAIKLDPTFGLAAFHSADAFYHVAAGDIDESPFTNDRPELSALEEIRRAMRLAGQSAQSRTQTAQARVNHVFFSDDWSDLKNTAKAFAIDAQTERGELEWFFGPVALLFTQQDADLRGLVDNRMARFDPMNGTVHAYKARSALIAGDYDSVERILRDASVNSFSSRIAETKGYLLIAQGNAVELSRHLDLSTGLSPLHTDFFLAMQLALEGKHDQALAALHSSAALKDESLHLAIGLAKIGEVKASKHLITMMEADELGIQKIAVGLAYGTGCGEFSIEFGPKFTSRLRAAGLDLPACIGLN